MPINCANVLLIQNSKDTSLQLASAIILIVEMDSSIVEYYPGP
jgi:hypothetical protein